jgi:alcohol dehydrogenase class IV
VLFDQVRVEPTDVSVKQAVQFATDGKFDGYVAVGGGSSMDTAKVANLYATYPADFLAYVNAPVGEARPVPGKLKPLIAVPTLLTQRNHRRGDLRSPGDARQTGSRTARCAGNGHH